MGAGGAGARGRGGPGLAPEVAGEIRSAAVAAGATAHHRERLVETMEEAVRAYERGRHPEALRLARGLVRELPGVAPIQELSGLAAYRAGRWREAASHLGTHRELTGEGAHLAVLMDCQRALGHPKRVAELWSELRQESPDADVLAEARMVAAGALADRGDLAGAIALLAVAGAGRDLRNPAERHVRQWYALGDLHERAGDIPRARELFERVARVDPEAYDVVERLEALGPGPRRGARRARGSGGGPRGASRKGPGEPRGAPAENGTGAAGPI